MLARDVDDSSLAHLLRQHRLKRGLTQEELAERARLSARAVSDIERGLKQAPRRSTLRCLSDALELSVDEAAWLHAVAHPATREVAQFVNKPTRRHNLPRQPSSFVGRTQELAEVRRLVELTPLVTLVGTGGVGKTRLAFEVAEGLAPEFSDGVWQVELGSLTDAGLLPQRVAATFGVSERGRGSLLARLTAALGHRQLLLVLDNCEHLIDAAAEVADLLLRACPQVRVLATSREPLGIGGEQVWPVLPLSLAPGARESASEAGELFVERACAAAPGFVLTDDNRQAVNDICRHLDGIPLAVELAAARVKTLTPAQIATRLADRFRLLVGGSRIAAPRQQTMEATLNWSYQLLGLAERRLLEQLAVFSGGWELEAAELVCADNTVPTADVLAGLDRLVARSLVQAHQGRFRMLETVREYADQRLRKASAVDVLHERHANYYLHLAEAVEPELKRAEQADWFERLAIEHDNFRAVLRWALADDRLEVGLRLAASLQRFWEVRGHWSEARRWLVDLLHAPSTAAQPMPLRAAAMAHAGNFTYLLGDERAGRQLLEEGLHLARIARAAGTTAFALHALGEICLSLGDCAAARVPLQESLALARQLDDAWATARVLSNLISVARGDGDGDIELARALAEEGIAIARRAGERRIESTLLINMASLQEHDPSAARTYLEHALATKRDLVDRYGAGRALHGLGWLAFDRGDLRDAWQNFYEAWATACGLGISNRPSADRPSALAGLACVAVRLGDAERALRLFAADAHIEVSGSVSQSAYLPESRRVMLETARQALGAAAGRLWAEGWDLTARKVQDEVWAVARIATELHPAGASGDGACLALSPSPATQCQAASPMRSAIVDSACSGDLWQSTTQPQQTRLTDSRVR